MENLFVLAMSSSPNLHAAPVVSATKGLAISSSKMPGAIPTASASRGMNPAVTTPPASSRFGIHHGSACIDSRLVNAYKLPPRLEAQVAYRKEAANATCSAPGPPLARASPNTRQVVHVLWHTNWH